MADLRQRVRIEATLQDKGASRGLDTIRGKSEAALGERQGMAFHAGKAKIALAALGAAVGAAAFGVARMVTEVARQNDEIAKMSTRLGASTEALSQLRFVAERSGIEFNTLTMGLQRMTRRIAEAAQGSGEAKDALRELGISARALNQLRPEEQFEAIAEAMQGVANNGDRVRLAMRLFDSDGVSLIQTMQGGAEGIRELRNEADSLGITLSGDAAKAAEEFNDRITNLNTAIDGLKKSLAEGVIEGLGDFQDGLGDPALRRDIQDFGRLLGGLSRTAIATARALALVKGLADTGKIDLVALGALAGGATEEGSTTTGELFTPGSTVNIQSQQDAAFESAIGGGSGEAFSSKLLGSRRDPLVIQSENRGKAVSKGFLSSYRTELIKNVDQDVNIPMKTAGTKAAISFLGDEESGDSLGLKPSLATGLRDFVLSGDLKSGAESFGSALGLGMVDKAADKVAGGIVDGLRDLTKGIDREDLIDAGQGIGNTMLDGLENVNFAGRFGADGEIGGGIGRELAGTFADAVQGGAFGLGIGTLIGDEITAKATTISGALGGAFAGPVGSIVASLTGALAVAVQSDVFSDLFGIADKDEKKAVSDLGTDIAAFGGLPGFFERIGGVRALGGQRGEAIRSETGSDALQKIIRLQFGATSEQAFDVARILDIASLNQGSLDQLNVVESLSRNAGLRSSESEIRNVLQAIGLGSDIDLLFSGQSSNATSGGDGTNVTVDGNGRLFDGGDGWLYNDAGQKVRRTNQGGTGTIDFDGGGIVPPAAGKPLGPAPRPRLSLSTGLDAFAAGGSFLSSYLESLGAPKGTQQGNNILNFLASGGSDQGARQYLSGFFDIVAAKGFHGTLTQPTAILAGEAGPERVDITPGGSDYVGGGRGGGSMSLYYVANINAMDANGVDAAAERLGERLRQVFLEMSERGLPVAYSAGIVDPPRV